MKNNRVTQPQGNPKARAEGIRKRATIRRLKAQGWSRNKIAGHLEITTQNMNRHLEIIDREDAEGQGAA